MKILFYQPFAKWLEHVGLLLDEIIKLNKEGHEIIYVYTNCCHNNCSANIYGDTAICGMCKLHMRSMIKLLPYSVDKIEIASYLPSKFLAHFEYNSTSDIKKIEYKGVKVGYAVLSSYISATRNLSIEINHSSRTFLDSMIIHACKLTDALDKIISIYTPQRICCVNARLLEQRPPFDLARQKHIDVYSYELYAGWGEPFYKTVFINSTPHNIQTIFNRYNTLWENVNMPLFEKQKLGEQFFIKKRNGIAVGDKSYTQNQECGKLPDSWNYGKENIVIFNSSEDEFAALGDEFDRLALFKSQYQGICFIADTLKDNINVHIWLRIHPNLKNISYRYHTELYKLPSFYTNITIIPADDKVSSYSLIDAADKIIVFGSTIGLESVYWGKPVILLAGAMYYLSNICYIPHSKDELKNLLKNKKLIAKNRQETIKLAFYLNYRNPSDLFNYIDFNYDIVRFGNRQWRTLRCLKFLGSYKLYTLYAQIAYKFFIKHNRTSIDVPLEEDEMTEL